MTRATPNWESGRITLTQVQMSRVKEGLTSAFGAPEDNGWGSPEWRVGNLILSFWNGMTLGLYWYVLSEPEPTKETTLGRKAALLVLSRFRKWPEGTGGTIFGDNGLTKAYGPLGKIAAANLTQSKKDTSGERESDVFEETT